MWKTCLPTLEYALSASNDNVQGLVSGPSRLIVRFERTGKHEDNSQAEGRGFEFHRPLQFRLITQEGTLTEWSAS